MDQLGCFWDASASVYKGSEGGRLAGHRRRARRVLLPLGVGFPPILVGIGFAEGEKRERGPATSPSPNRTRGRGRRAAHVGLPLLFSTKAHHGPFSSRGGSGNLPGTPVKSRFHPEHFRYPNIGFQYINLYVSTISILLVMSVITSGTPNNLRYIKMHKLII